MTSPPPIAEPLVDRYAIERELGHGGMATVYLAEEKKHGRQVAIKVMKPELAASVGVERFLREIGIAARLAHPHIVPLIDSGEAGGALYYVSPYVPGGSLRDRLEREGALPLRDVFRIAQEVGAGLDYAHRAGFVHRDVKPENILFADGHAQLADFGVARATCPDEHQTVTGAGMALGTPEYMSPEQASGERELGSASDVYSLACVVFEMFAGAPPFRGDSARAVMAKQVTEPARPVRTLRPEVPVAVEEALTRALSKAPEHRFSSVAEFVEAIGRESMERGRIPTVASRSLAVLPFVNASPDPENEYLSDGITDELIDALSKLGTLRVASRTSVFALKGKQLDVRAIGALLGVSVMLEGTVRKAGQRLRITAQLSSTDDGRLLWSQRYDRELEDVFAIQDEIAGTIVDTLRATQFADGEGAPPKRYTQNVKAYNLYLRGRYAWNKRTQEGVAEGIEYFEQAIREDPEFALAYTGLADSFALQIDYRSVPVDEGFARAKAHARKALELDDELAEAHASLAWSYFIYDWDWAAAEQEFLRALAINPRYASTHQWYAFLLASQGKIPESLVEGHTAQELDPTSVSSRRSLGMLYLYARRFERARYHLSRAIEMNPEAEETYRVLGLSLTVEGNHVESVRVLREASVMHGAGSYTMSSLGYALAKAGQREEAEAVLAELHVRRERSYVSPVAFSTMYLGLGDHDAALAWAERAFGERRGWLAYLNVNPIFDDIRGDPRFDALVRRMRLPV
ncbi:MAG: protein kinase [Gemmatimonadota bacterium]|nr:protein kinase [Gemmatimonadota bacterium]